ncbi:glycosyltransferase family 10 domain-containing protein [uncultured Methanoregula sp.]|uniref:glycosyltransferase family 10 domain-containing protein n=1 Tax=uncultured Methanoregula sp. TaxID=1005933 RepID=UPI002AAB13CF|nr:glycosyltransferase family 10 [uncultured Methanoregula sp.]
MTTKATFYTGSYYCNNRQFDIDDPVANRDNCLYPLYLLKQKFAEYDVDLSTQDINKPKDSDFIIYNEMPRRYRISPKKQNYLLIFESKLIRPQNWNIRNHRFFKKIFTWDDDFVDGEKYFKINFSHQVPSSLPSIGINDKKLCTLIAANKVYHRPNELYSERVNAIRWFEGNHPQDFDLYGQGWDLRFYSGILGHLNCIMPLRRIRPPTFSSYRGPIKDKLSVLKNYKFSICYENLKNTKGYITEKIFDCFFAGCVPVYWGAPNITDHIPPDTFIDRRKFSTYNEIYEFMTDLPDEKYAQYLSAIRNFLQSEKMDQFTAEKFADTIIKEIISE